MNLSTNLNTLTQAIQLFADLIGGHQALEQEFLGSRLEFLGPGSSGQRTDGELDQLFEEDSGRAWRHLEWFLFDRPSQAVDGLPADALHGQWVELAAEQMDDEVPASLLMSITGIFEVLEVHSDGQLDLCDLAGLTQLSLRSPGGSSGYGLGDLLVGRFFPGEEGLHQPSPAIVSFRDLDLLSALRQDLMRLRENRSHAVMRMTQLELERMFWGDTSGAPNTSTPSTGDCKPTPGSAKDPVGEMEHFFAQSGVPRQTIASWLGILERAPQDPRALAAGADELVGGLLDQLAFETEVDLGQARAHLLAAWSACKNQPAPEEAHEPAPDGDPLSQVQLSESLKEFDSDRSSGIDVDTSFKELERRLGLENIEEEDPGDAPDFPGVVGAMVEEFLWEAGLTDDTTPAAWAEGLRLFAEYTGKIGVFENLSEREVLSFLTFWLPESRRLNNAQQAGHMVTAMYAFANWASDAHEVQILGDNLCSERDALENSLARVVQANASLAADEDQAGELFECCEPCDGERARVRDEQGEERDVSFAAPLAVPLEPGDLLRGYTQSDGRFVIGCCYPPQARGLKQRTV